MMRKKVENGFFEDGEQWFRIFAKGVKRIVTDHRFSGGEYRMLLFLMTEVRYQNIAYVTRRELREGLDIGDSTMYRILTSLFESGLVRRDEQGIYLLDPSLVWVGRHAARSAAVQKWSA